MADGEPLLAGVKNRVSIQFTRLQTRFWTSSSRKSKSILLNTMLGYVVAISNRHIPVEGQALITGKTVKKWVSSLKLTKGVARSLVTEWNVRLDAGCFKVRNTSLKHLTWKTVFLLASTSVLRA